MKSKIKVFIILAVVFYFGIEFANPFKEEVVDLKKFTDYYDTTEETNGGVTLLMIVFILLRRSIILPMNISQ